MKPGCVLGSLYGGFEDIVLRHVVLVVFIIGIAGAP